MTGLAGTCEAAGPLLQAIARFGGSRRALAGKEWAATDAGLIAVSALGLLFLLYRRAPTSSSARGKARLRSTFLVGDTICRWIIEVGAGNRPLLLSRRVRRHRLVQRPHQHPGADQLAFHAGGLRSRLAEPQRSNPRRPRHPYRATSGNSGDLGSDPRPRSGADRRIA